MKAIRNSADFWSGLLFLAAGFAFLWIARNYSFGTPLRMGPSFFPVVLSVILALIDIATIVRSLTTPGEPIEAFTIKGMIAITLGAILFGALLHGAGLVIAVCIITLVTAYASVKFQWRTALLMAAVLAIFCCLVFVYGLGLPMPIFGFWFVG